MGLALDVTEICSNLSTEILTEITAIVFFFTFTEQPWQW